MAVSLGRKIRRIGLMPGKVKDPDMTTELRQVITDDLRAAAKLKRKKK
jgi:hypothetical protein